MRIAEVNFEKEAESLDPDHRDGDQWIVLILHSSMEKTLQAMSKARVQNTEENPL